MERILNALKSHAGALDQAQGRPRFATVASVDAQSATARVVLQPEGVLTGWLPVLSAWTGSNWGLVCLPGPGDQVLVIGQESDAENGVIIGGVFSSKRPPPLAPVGEFWLVHSTGASLKLKADGTVWVNGDLHVQGDVYDVRGPLSRLRDDYDRHTHGDSHGGRTSPPDLQD